MSAMEELLKPVKTFLTGTTLTSFTSARPCHLVSVKRTATVKEALKVLDQSKILSVPVLDSNEQYCGCLSTQDLLKAFVAGLPHDLQDAEWVSANPEAAMAALSRIGNAFTEECVANVAHAGELWVNNQSSTLWDVVVEGFFIKEHTVHHRIVVCNPAPHDTTHDHHQGKISTMLVHGWQPWTVVSQSDMIRSVWQHKDSMGPLMDMTVEDLEVYMGAAVTVPASTPAAAAFAQMARDHKSSLGITTEDGSVLLGNLSGSDMRQLAELDFGLLALPVGEYILVARGLASAADALAGKHVPGVAEGKWQEAMSAINVVCVNPTTTIGDTLDMLVKQRLHRVYVVDGKQRPTGIITLTDMLRALVQ